mmetsp:Transcript_75043/g.200204  ORF Transcript_75043/g.200204 Transcript_75043/m.200204 type:complete len:362 (-) Transcript_75043:309-1394(-)
MASVEITPGKLWGLRRLADDKGLYKMLAVDQRPPIKNLVKERRGVEEAPYEDVAAVKRALVQYLAPSASALLLDPHVAYPQSIDLVSPKQGVILTLEDSIFEETPGGRKSAEIENWSVQKIKTIGGDAVKVLAWYRPDADPSICAFQQEYVRKIGQACKEFDLPFVFEMLVYPLPSDSSEAQTQDYVEHPEKRPDLVLDSVSEFAKPEYGVDLFKLESPVLAKGIADPDKGDKEEVAKIQALFDDLGKRAGRPWVMLSAGAGRDDFKNVLKYAYKAGASGFLAGRAIWWDAFQNFPDMDKMGKDLQQKAVPYFGELNKLTDAKATPWEKHEVFGGEGPKLAGKGQTFRESVPAAGGGCVIA